MEYEGLLLGEWVYYNITRSGINSARIGKCFGVLEIHERSKMNFESEILLTERLLRFPEKRQLE